MTDEHIRRLADKYITADGARPAAASYDEGGRHWSIVTKTRRGEVSVVRELTLRECRETYVRLNPHRGCSYFMYEAYDPGKKGGFRAFSGAGLSFDGDDIELREVFGPPGWDDLEVEGWDEWPKAINIEWDDPQHIRHRRVAEPRAAVLTDMDFDPVFTARGQAKSEAAPEPPETPEPDNEQRRWLGLQVSAMICFMFALAAALIYAAPR